MESLFLFYESHKGHNFSKVTKTNYFCHDLEQTCPQRPLAIRQTSPISNPAWSKDSQTGSLTCWPTSPVHVHNLDPISVCTTLYYQPVPSDTRGPRGKGAGQGVIGAEMLICRVAIGRIIVALLSSGGWCHRSEEVKPRFTIVMLCLHSLSLSLSVAHSSFDSFHFLLSTSLSFCLSSTLHVCVSPFKPP